jgi:hypothetical protein
MSIITIYPNNSVTIDGISAPWEKKDFRAHGIPMERMRNSSLSEEEAEIKIANGNKYVIFPTSWHVDKKELAKGKTWGRRTCANRACRELFVARHWRQDTCCRRCSIIVNQEKYKRILAVRNKQHFPLRRNSRRGLIHQTRAAA